MANITRKQHKIFAALSANNGQFGSDQAGSPVVSNDPDVIQALPAYNNGWLNATIGSSELPTLEDMQGLQYNNSYQTAYLLQKGIPEWNNLTDYHTGDIVRQIGGSRLYKSITDDNINNPIIDLSNWQYLGNLDNLFTTEVISTEGDLIKGSSSGEAERLPVGSNNQILQSNGTNPVWSNDLVINNLTVNDKLNTQPNTATISSGAITYTGAYMVVDTEGGASSDTLDTINGGTSGDRLLLRGATSGRNIIISDNTGNIQTNNNTNFTLEPTHLDSAEFYYDGGNWIQTARRLDLDFRNSKSTNGYTYLPNGLILQWMTVSSTSDSNENFNFPIAFPNNAFCAITNSASSPATNDYKITGLTTSQITLDRADGINGSNNVYVFVIGN